MVSILSLWLPILLSAVIVFILSAIFHMVFKYHNSDFSKVPDQDKVMEEMQKFNIPPGEYMMPYTTDSKERESAEFKEKMAKGPMAMMTVMPAGQTSMAKSLAIWFIYSIIVGIFAAYISGRALGPGAHYLSVFRFVGATSFLGYTLALWQDSIWFARSWTTTVKNTFDGLVYALMTAGMFGWLWPV